MDVGEEKTYSGPMTESRREAKPELVETFPYKGFVIEVELYRDSSNGLYFPWPYVGVIRPYSDAHRHFLVSPSEFSTKEAALKAAIEEGKRKIDAGFNPSEVD